MLYHSICSHVDYNNVCGDHYCLPYNNNHITIGSKGVFYLHRLLPNEEQTK